MLFLTSAWLYQWLFTVFTELTKFIWMWPTWQCRNSTWLSRPFLAKFMSDSPSLGNHFTPIPWPAFHDSVFLPISQLWLSRHIMLLHQYCSTCLEHSFHFAQPKHNYYSKLSTKNIFFKMGPFLIPSFHQNHFRTPPLCPMQAAIIIHLCNDFCTRFSLAGSKDLLPLAHSRTNVCWLTAWNN